MSAPPTRADYYGEYDYPQDRTQRMCQNTMMAGAATGQYPQRTGGFNAQTYGDDGGYPPERKSWARRWLPWLIPAAVIIAVIAVAASLLTSGGKTYFVPSVDGQKQVDAVSQMKQAGFDNLHIVQQTNGSLQKGDVISTSPANGATVSSLSTQVTINVSAGVGKVSVPNVVNQSQNAATTALTNAHLNYNIQQDPNSIKPQGTVTRQDPAGGTPVSPGQTVTIYVSPGGVTVPSVIGLNYLKATQTLQNDHLTVTANPGNDQDSPPANPGDVYQQSITPNTVVAQGTAITLTYEMAATPSPTPSPTPTDSTSPSPTATDSPTAPPSTPPASPTASTTQIPF
jgi:eukaryotic-like serine/threonine-protein kinase